MQWYKDLLLFGFPNEESIDIEDSDVKLLPSLVEKAVLPKLTGNTVILLCFHAYSKYSKVFYKLFRFVLFCKT